MCRSRGAAAALAGAAPAGAALAGAAAVAGAVAGISRESNIEKKGVVAAAAAQPQQRQEGDSVTRETRGEAEVAEAQQLASVCR